jgi:hypothetical protein
LDARITRAGMSGVGVQGTGRSSRAAVFAMRGCCTPQGCSACPARLSHQPCSVRTPT